MEQGVSLENPYTSYVTDKSGQTSEENFEVTFENLQKD